MNRETLPQELAGLMHAAQLISKKEADSFSRVADIQCLQSDGSCRKFFRVSLHGKILCLAVAPAVADGKDLAEARAAGLIGRHLWRRGAPVPAIYGWDQDSGLILFEDLGDTRLHTVVEQGPHACLAGWYRQCLDQLVHMQFACARDFDTGWCWDTPRYDQQLMIDRESRYFLRAFWQDMLGLTAPEGIEDEFREIAALAGRGSPEVFLHRDFQSRNIMIKDGRVRFIDYQGGRLGPPGYDLASLLIDPYAALSYAQQEELLHTYLDIVSKREAIDIRAFRRQYSLLALQRNLQIIGAFSFLSRERKKMFFARFIHPSLTMLHDRLSEPFFASFPVLRRMVATARTATGVS